MESITENYNDAVEGLKNNMSNAGNEITNVSKSLNNYGEKFLENNKESIDAIGSSINKTMEDSKNIVTGTASNIKDKFKPFFDFMESNSLVAKFAFLLLVIFAFIVLLGFIINILAYFFDNSSHQKLITGMVDASTSMLIFPQDPNTKDAKTIYRSINQTGGIEFTWSVWIYVNDLGESNGKYKHIFSKGNYGPTQNGLNEPNNAPGLYIYPDTNQLSVVMDTYEVVGEVINIPDIPMNKWVNVIIICRNKEVDVYINGTITKTMDLVGVPKQNYGEVYVAMNNGFNGYISNLWYYSYALGTVAVEELVKRGPNTHMVDGQSMNDKNAEYLSLRWYFDGTNNEFNP